MESGDAALSPDFSAPPFVLVVTPGCRVCLEADSLQPQSWGLGISPQEVLDMSASHTSQKRLANFDGLQNWLFGEIIF